jgi:uncharacterized protein (DUF305 family)
MSMKPIVWSWLTVAVAVVAVLVGWAVPSADQSTVAVTSQISHMTADNSAMSDPNWAELTKSMQTMHAAMEAAAPSGNDDVDFVNLMLPHHHAAVDMARAELLHGSDRQVRQLAQEIIADQESEIQLMQLWLERQRTRSKEPQRSDSQKEH